MMSFMSSGVVLVLLGVFATVKADHVPPVGKHCYKLQRRPPCLPHPDCSPLANPADGSLSSDSVSYNTTVTLFCDGGYTPFGDTTTKCQDGGVWSNLLAECKKDCSPLASPANANLNTDSVVYNTAVTLSCVDGYTSFGPTTTYCQGDGVWSNELAECKKDCPPLASPAVGTLSSTSLIYGTEVMLVCNYGYTAFGEQKTNCQDGGVWSHILADCRQDCPPLASPAGGTLSTTDLSYGTEVMLVCNNGYTAFGEPKTNCQDGGVWSHTLADCRQDCPTIIAPENGYLATPTSFSQGSVVSVLCNNGYALSGDGDLFCQTSATWDKVRPNCVSARYDCKDINKEGGKSSGVYSIRGCDNCGWTDVYCDMDTDNGGWMVFQCRKDGSVDFYRNWDNYTQGFGNVNGEHWKGLKIVHDLTSQADYELWINLKDFDGNEKYARYDTFIIGDAASNYVLNVGDYKGNAGDSLATVHHGQPFSTYDRDNDNHAGECAEKFTGAWWYKSCHASNLNGRYLNGWHNHSYADGINWYKWRGYHYSLKETKMMIRRKPTECEPLPAIANGYYDTTDTTLGTVVNVTCDPGHALFGTPELRCLDEVFLWDHALPSCNPVRTRKDCQDLFKEGYTTSGTYTVVLCTACPPVDVYCDMTSYEGGWTAFQYRKDGSVDFYRDWNDYERGFGTSEYWLGNYMVSEMTHEADYELLILLEDFDTKWVSARYKSFSISGPLDNYILSVGAYSGDAGDSLTSHHNGQPFSTKDRDNDANSGACATKFHGAWWYRSCHLSNLNGFYHGGAHTSYADGVNWYTFKQHRYSLKTSLMMMRRLPTECPVLTEPDHGSLINNGVAVGSAVTAVCDTGYTLVGASTLTCMANFQWDLSVPTCNPTNPMEDCKSLKDSGSTTGIYNIRPCLICPIMPVYCDMDTDGGGWMVFQRRVNASVSFIRKWKEYEVGFGVINENYWLGNRQLYMITNYGGDQELRIDMHDFDNDTAYAKYNEFKIGSATEYYKLTVSGFNGDQGDSFSPHNQQSFSTYDQDHDIYSGNCADRFKGGWWYKKCHQSNLNGVYHGGAHTSYADGVNWYTWKEYHYSLKYTDMKMRRIDSTLPTPTLT